MITPMRYLRMLTNAIVGGVLGAAYLAVLVLQLNPHVPIVSVTAARWFVTLIAFYGLYLSVAVYLLILVREVLASRPLRPAWFSVRSGVAGCGVLRRRGGRHHVGAICAGFSRCSMPAPSSACARAPSPRRSSPSCSSLIVLLRYSFGRQGSRTAAALLLASMMLSVAVPLWLRGPGELPVPRGATDHSADAARRHAAARAPDPARRRRALGFIRQRVAAGQLPNFGAPARSRRRDRSRDDQADASRAGLGRGRDRQISAEERRAVERHLPRPCRRRGSGRPAAGLLLCGGPATIRVSSPKNRSRRSSLRARPLWDILADYGVASGIVNWPLTHPARPARVRRQRSLRRSRQLAAAPRGCAGRLIRRRAVDIAREAFDRWQQRPWHDVLPAFGATEPPPSGFLQARWDPAYSAGRGRARAGIRDRD